MPPSTHSDLEGTKDNNINTSLSFFLSLVFVLPGETVFSKTCSSCAAASVSILLAVFLVLDWGKMDTPQKESSSILTLKRSSLPEGRDSRANWVPHVHRPQRGPVSLTVPRRASQSG